MGLKYRFITWQLNKYPGHWDDTTRQSVYIMSKPKRRSKPSPKRHPTIITSAMETQNAFWTNATTPRIVVAVPSTTGKTRDNPQSL